MLFTRKQIAEAHYGFESGLSDEQVAIYFQPEFSEAQMTQARKGLEHGLTMEQMSFCCRTEFDWAKMHEAILGFTSGLTMEQVSFYYKPEFDHRQMELARLGFQYGLALEQVSFYYRPEFDWLQMDQAVLGFMHGLTLEQVSSYYKLDYNKDQMDEARLCLEGDSNKNEAPSESSQGEINNSDSYSEDTLYKICEDYPSIILDQGFEWCSLHQVPDGALKRLEKLFAKRSTTYKVKASVGLLGLHLSDIVKLRDYYRTKDNYPGEQEKEWTIREIERVQAQKLCTGIDPDSYDSLLERLRAISNSVDVAGYRVDYHV